MQDNKPQTEAHQSGDPAADRLEQARHWAGDCLQRQDLELEPVSGDASFRRYFRIQSSQGPLILMDAPPGCEDSKPFVDVAGRLRRAGLHTPDIIRFDFEQGFGLLEDLGDELYRNVLTPGTADTLFPDLFEVLRLMAQNADARGLPPCDASHLQTELDLFTHWYLEIHRNRPLTEIEQQHWQAACRLLIDNAMEQDQVFVHRDFHSCNLLFLQGQLPGVIDFQDAVHGPLSYDFASLLWDRYISWPRPQLEAWMETYRTLLGLEVDSRQWIRWCDLTGLQRNLKIVGIFARLHYRDDKTGYLEMIPRFYQYLLDVVPRYPELSPLQIMLERSECAP